MKIKLFRALALLLPFLMIQAGMAVPYITVEVETGRVLAHKDAFDRWYPASLTKIMTAYVTFRALQAGSVSLTTPVIISARASKAPPSRSGYRPGSVLSLDNALTLMLVRSANDIAISIGETVSGSETAFVQHMNAEAQRIGLIGTHFTNASGLPDMQNYSTARDMALLAVQIRREFPQYAYYFEIPAVDLGQGKKKQPNSNYLLGRYSGADGMKTGFICASGFNLAASATRNGRTIVAVVLGADRIDVREGLAAQLLTEGFDNPGTSQVTLSTLRPYGTRLKEAANLREQICSAEAWKTRAQYRNEKGEMIFNSPFITALQAEPHAVAIQLISGPRKLKKGELPIWKIPVPAERPPYQ